MKSDCAKAFLAPVNPVLSREEDQMVMASIVKRMRETIASSESSGSPADTHAFIPHSRATDQDGRFQIMLAPAEYSVILRNDLMSFIERAFYELSPNTPFISGRHIELIAAKLEACRRGEDQAIDHQSATTQS